eukprot:COSAG01_NODE_12049_length_1807_cov_2.809133_1_plen_77_part_00
MRRRAEAWMARGGGAHSGRATGGRPRSTLSDSAFYIGAYTTGSLSWVGHSLRFIHSPDSPIHRLRPATVVFCLQKK